MILIFYPYLISLSIIFSVLYLPFLFIQQTKLNDLSDIGNFLAGTIGTLAAIIAAILLYFTLKHQREYSKEQDKIKRKENFENNFYKMIDNLNNQISLLYYIEKHDANPIDRFPKEKIIHHNGINVFKYFSLFFLSYFNDPTKSDKLKKSDIILNKENLGNVLLNIKKRFHSQFRQIFRIIKYLFDYIENNYKENNIKENHYNFYKKYVKIQIPEYLKFIIALYRIYDKRSQLARALIDNYCIIEQYDFYNYISDKKEYFMFMSKLGIKKKTRKEINKNQQNDSQADL